MIFGNKLLNPRELNDEDGILDVLAEAIKGVFQPNTNSGRTQFRALVLDDSIRINVTDVAQLGGLNIDGGSPESTYTNTSRQAARIRILEEDTPHGCIPSPKSILKPDQEDLNSIALHPLAVSQVTYENTLMSTLTPGDVVWCSYERGPDGGKTQNLQIIPREYIQKGDSRVSSMTHRVHASVALQGPSKSLSEIYAGVTTDIPSPTEVLNNLKSLYPGASEDFLFGLMANIEAETDSTWDPMVGGDPGPNNSRCLEAIGSKGHRGRYCAIGMYQMNIANKATAGSAYLKWSGDIDPVSAPNDAMLALSNWQNQNEYVKSWMVGKGADFTQSSPPKHGSWTEYVMKEFENPADQSASKVAGREARARRLRNSHSGGT
tara:strand:+ start:7129 stop:8259 length:1131 start_codon:yes stop_codon:yes gene_type:complete